MTIEVPPTAATTVVDTPIDPKTEEPTLNIQIEPPTANKESPEDLVTPNEEKPTSAKRKALFNNPFKVTKKEASSPETPTSHTDESPKEHAHVEEKAAAATGTGENKITKSLGNLYTRIKQTASSHNIKDAAGTSPPPAATSSEHPITEEKEAAAAAAAAAVAEKKTASSSSSSSSSSSEGGDAQVHEAETPSASANHNNTNKRQSLLSKLFGGSGKKKEEEHAEADHSTREVTTQAHEPDTHDGTPSAIVADPEPEERPASPPLSRRVTGFFAKKIPSYNKKHQKSNDKAEEEHAGATDVTATTTTTAEVVTPQREPTEATTTTTKDAVAAATAATGVTDTETTTNKEASPAPVTTSA